MQCNSLFSNLSLHQWFSTKVLLLRGDIDNVQGHELRLETCEAVMTEGNWYWYLVGRDQGCSVSTTAERPSHQRVIQVRMSAVLRLRKPSVQLPSHLSLVFLRKRPLLYQSHFLHFAFFGLLFASLSIFPEPHSVLQEPHSVSFLSIFTSQTKQIQQMKTITFAFPLALRNYHALTTSFFN